MTQESSQNSDLKGLAKSLNALFEESLVDESDEVASVEPEEEDASGKEESLVTLPDLPGSAGIHVIDATEDVAWVAETGVDPEAPAASEEPIARSHDPLMRALAVYLRAEPEERAERSDVLREAYTDAHSRNAGAPMMEAIETLVRAGVRDEVSLGLARDLLGHVVAKLFAMRLAESASDERSRADLLALVGQLGPEMATAIAEELAEAQDPSVRRALVEAIVLLGDDAQPVLEQMVEDDRWYVVRNGVAVLGKMGDEGSVQYLTTTLANDDARVRKETIGALTRIGGEDAEFLVSSKLGDGDPGVRAAAARAVGTLKVERSLKVLMELLENDPEAEVVVEAARALGQLGDPTAVNALEKRAVGNFFAKPPTEIRIAAYQGLAGMATPRARQILDEAKEDKDVEVRHVVRSLIRQREEAMRAAESAESAGPQDASVESKDVGEDGLV